MTAFFPGKIIVFGGAQPGNGSGNDYAGEIVALGPGTHTVEVGQRVCLPQLFTVWWNLGSPSRILFHFPGRRVDARRL